MKNLLFCMALAISCVALGQETTFTKVINNDSTDQAVSAFQKSNGDYYLLSNTNSSGQGLEDFQVTRTDGLGNSIWSYTFGTNQKDVASSMKPTSDGGAIICGYSKGFGSSAFDQAFVSKMDAAGTLTWTKRIITDSNSRALDVMQAKNGVYYLTGYTEIDTLDKNMLASRIDGTGNVTWIRSLGGEGDDIGNAISEDQLGRIIIAGSTSNDSVNIGGPGDIDISLVALTAGGAVDLSKNIGSSSTDYATNIIGSTNNTIYVGGVTEAGLGISKDVFLLKVDTNFNVSASMWAGVTGDDELMDMKISGTNELILLSSSQGPPSARDAYLFRVLGVSSVSTGVVIGGAAADATSGLAIAGNNNTGYSVYSSGFSFGNTSTEDANITKLNSLDQGNCSTGIDIMEQGTPSFTSGTFARGESTGGNAAFTFTRSTLTNSDSTLCCALEARVADDSLVMCQQDVLNIGRQGISGYQYSWTTVSGPSFVSSSANPAVSPTASTEYKLVVTSLDGTCTADSALVYVKVNPRQTQQTIRDTSYCAGDSITIQAQSGMNFYLWNYDNQVFNGASLKVKKVGEIRLTTIDNNSCIYLDTLQVSEDPIPTFSLGVDTTICDNLTITLSGPTGMSSYVWNGVSTANVSLTTGASQVHSLEVTSPAGCVYYDEIQILTDPSSTFSLGADTSICEGASVTLFGPTVLTDYKWNGVSNLGSSFDVSASGEYAVEAYNSFDCPSYDTINVSIKLAPAFSLGNDTGSCDAVNIPLVGPVGAASYLWFNGSEQPSFTATGPGLYYLEIEDAQGCSYIDSISIEQYTSPTIFLGNDTIIPSSGQLTLTPGTGYSSYAWSTGASSESITVSDTGSYSVTVTDMNGCTGYDEIRVPSTASITYLNGFVYKAYPNPATDKLYIKVVNTPTEESYRDVIGAVTLIDVTGKEVLNTEIGQNHSFVDVSGLETGLYRLILNTNNQTLSFSVLVNH